MSVYLPGAVVVEADVVEVGAATVVVIAVTVLDHGCQQH